jgi:hypothetical protein
VTSLSESSQGEVGDNREKWGDFWEKWGDFWNKLIVINQNPSDVILFVCRFILLLCFT